MSFRANRHSRSPQDLLFEDRREREFYRYYQPIRELTENGPPLCDLSKPDHVRQHVPSSSPDRALTAFCQLGALRLGTRRAMLFFFDSNNGYVLAEATRTLSLQDDSVYDDIDDSLWLGHAIIPRGGSVCEHTVLLPANEGSNADGENKAVVHVVNDLREDTRFCDRPFVVGGPKARFYAGVPITTPKGINIGAYCVLDDKKRDGLDSKGTQFLRDMAATVMAHLDMARAKSEHKRGTRMIAGLGAFIEDAPALREEGPETNHKAVPQVLNVPSAVDPGQGSLTAVPSATTQIEHGRNPGELLSKVHSVALKPEVEATNPFERTFKRAAQLVREAVQVDGVIFLDASVSTYAGLADLDTASNTDDNSDSAVDSAGSGDRSGTDGERQTSTKSTHIPGRPNARILGSSIFDPKADCESVVMQLGVTERLLRSMLKRYPRRKIWNFNEFGDASSDDENWGGSSGLSPCACPQGDDTTQAPIHTTACPVRRKKDHLNDSKGLRRLFPEARSLGIVGMWDHTRSRWHAACIFWTCSPLRLFSEESEGVYVAAFCDVILAEIHRVEAQTSDRAKSDFLSTISHELRSPLHGISGSVECLQDEPMDAFSADLVSQIDVCGRTLVDIIDHLLDYSKINHHSKARSEGLPRGRSRRSSSAASSSAGVSAIVAHDMDVALDQITEEVVESAVYSFSSSRDPETILNRKVAVILDIDRSSMDDWRCNIAVGAWKRILFNLVSNSQKYTSAGKIAIVLRATPIPNKRRTFSVTLTVSDTGKGMTKEFLETDLFRAFSQEDALLEGTGLGMNLVGGIVKAFNGTIDVQSEKGVGTTVSVTIPVERSRLKRDNPKTSEEGVSGRLAGVCVGIMDPSSDLKDDSTTIDGPRDTTRKLVLASAERMLAETGIRSLRLTSQESEHANVYLITEQDLPPSDSTESHETGQPPNTLYNRPIVVLCDSILSARRLRPKLSQCSTGHVELIAQPAGPHRLIKAIVRCMDVSRPGFASTNQSTSSDPFRLKMPPPTIAKLNSFSSTPFTPPVKHDALHSLAGAAAITEGNGSVYRRGLEQTEFRVPRLPEHRRVSSPIRSSSSDMVSRTKRAELQTASSYGNPRPIAPAGLSLLLVDDNPINLKLLVTYATKYGHRKTTATDGLEAVAAYKAACLRGADPSDRVRIVGDSIIAIPEKPQVILMDINMPNLNGFEATQQIRAFEKLHGVAPAMVIALTGLGSASAQQEAFTSGVDLFLTKPVRLRELTKILEGVAL